jgi:hypothetical protein
MKSETCIGPCKRAQQFMTSKIITAPRVVEMK